MLRGVHCHSAFQHYHMFHSDHGGENFGSIFNTTYNINYGNQKTGGFWGGFGFGLGNVFGNILGGLFGGNGMGFGMPSFGMGNFGFGNFGMPQMNWGMPYTGMGIGNGLQSLFHRETAKDKDDAAVKKYEKQINNKDLTEEKARKIYDEIKDIVDNEKYKDDNNNDGLDKNAYSNLLKDLEIKFPNLKASAPKSTAQAGKGTVPGGEGTVSGGDGTAQAGKGTVPGGDGTAQAGKSTVPGGEGTAQAGKGTDLAGKGTDPASKGTDPASGTTLKVGGKDIALEDLKTEDILNGEISEEDIKKLTPEQAKKLLNKLGVKENENFNFPLNINALRLLAQSGMIVKMAQNTKLLGTKNDAFIIGKVSNIKINENKTISYEVDCNNEKSSLKCKYKFEQQIKEPKVNKQQVKVTATLNKNAKLKNEKIASVIYFTVDNNNQNSMLTRNKEAYLTKKN